MCGVYMWILHILNTLSTHLRSSRVANRYLHHFHVDNTDSPLCACKGGVKETVNHFLIHCPRYNEPCAQLESKVGVGGMRMEKLLGYPQLVLHTLEFIENTKRMPF